MADTRDIKEKTKNLIEIQPGESGNPAGRPKGSKNGPRAILTRLLKTKSPIVVIDMIKAEAKGALDDGDFGTWAETIAYSLMLEATTGNNRVTAARLIFDQTEQPLPRLLEISGPDGKPVEVSDARAKLKGLLGRGQPAKEEDGAPGAD